MCWGAAARRGWRWLNAGAAGRTEGPFLQKSLDLAFLLVAVLFSLQCFMIRREGNPFFVSELLQIPAFVNAKTVGFVLPVPIQNKINSFYAKLQIFALKVPF